MFSCHTRARLPYIKIMTSRCGVIVLVRLAKGRGPYECKERFSLGIR